MDGRPESHPFGLYGLHGNVFEWCRDAFDPQAYRQRVDGVADPETLATADDQTRVLRGGSCNSPAPACRSAFRIGSWPTERWGYCGFRVCLLSRD